MYKALLLIFLSIMISSCFKDSSIKEKQNDSVLNAQINTWVFNESKNWWWNWEPSYQELKR